MPWGLEYFGTHQMPLDRSVGRNKALHDVHIGALGRHRHGKHLHAEVFGDRKVPVVSRNGTKELTPPCFIQGSQPATPCVIRQATASNIIFRLELPPTNTSPGARPTVRQREPLPPECRPTAVIAGVQPIFRAEVGLRTEHIEKIIGEIELIGARLAAGHIQLQALFLIGAVLFLQRFFAASSSFLFIDR